VDVSKDEMLESVRKLREMNKVTFDRVSLPYKSTSPIEDVLKEKQAKISEKIPKLRKSTEKKVVKKSDKKEGKKGE
jgi:hypothetical protein